MKVATKFYVLAAVAAGLVALNASLHRTAARTEAAEQEATFGHLIAGSTATRAALEHADSLGALLRSNLPTGTEAWRERSADIDRELTVLGDLLQFISVQNSHRGDAAPSPLQKPQAAHEAMTQAWRSIRRHVEADPSLLDREVAKNLSPHLAAEIRPALLGLGRSFELDQQKIAAARLTRETTLARWHLVDIGLLLVIMIAAAIATRRWVVAPLRRIEADARLISHGERSSLSFSYVKDDEIGAVARAVNDTVDKLRSTAYSLEELERQVASRTAELRERERELSESRAQLQRALDGSRLATWDWDLPAQRIYAPGLAEKLLGYAPGEVPPTAEGMNAIVHPADLPIAIAAMQDMVAGLSSRFDVELRHLNRQGEWRWIRVAGCVTARDAAGQATHAAGTHADIHNWKSAEEQLARREQQLALALAASGSALWDHDTVAGTVYLDERWAHIVGGPTGPRMSNLRALYREVHPEDRAEVHRVYQDIHRGVRDDYFLEHRVRHADGGYRWIRSCGTCIDRDDRGRARRIIGTHIEITTLKASQATLSRQAEFFSALNQTAIDLLSRRQRAEMLQEIVTRCALILDAPYAELALIEGDELVTHGVVGERIAQVGERNDRTTAVLSWRAVDSRLPIVLEDYSRVPEARDIYRQRQFHSVALFPIIHGDRCLGVIGLCRTAEGSVFNLRNLEEGQLFAKLTALVLHHTDIYEDAVRAADERTVALRQSEARLREAQRIAHLGHWVYHFNGDNSFLSTSDEVFRIFGLDAQRDKFDREKFYALVHAEDRVRFQAEIESAFGGRKEFKFDYRIVRPDGVLRFLHSEGEPLLGPDGAAIGMQGVIFDITDRVSAENALRESEALYRNLVETIDHGYYVADFRSLFSYVSPAMSAMGGFAPGELLGKSSFRLIAEEDRPRVMEEYRVWRDDPTVTNVRSEFRVVAKNGRKFWVEQSTHFERDFRGKVREGRNLIRDISERRAAEAALRESEVKFRDLFDYSPVSVVVTSLPEGRIVDISTTAVRVFGYDREKIVGRNTVEIGLWVHEADRDVFVRTMARDGFVNDFETVMRRQDGTVLDVIVNSRVIAIGGAQCALSTLTDVSDIRQTQRALRESETRFHSVFDMTPIPMVLAEMPESRIVEANPAAEKFFGYTRTEALGQRTLDLNVWEDPQMRDRCLAELRQYGVVTNYEGNLRLKDGSIVTVLLNASIIRLGDREMLLSSLLDITERKRVEAQLRDSQERHQAVFEESPVMIFLLSFPEGKIVAVNSTACAGFQVKREAILGHSSVQLNAWVDQSDRQRYLQMLQENRRVVNFETRLRRLNGEVFPALFSGSLIEIAGARYSLNSIQDITIQRQAEERLRQTQKMESLGTLAGGIAHDFNNLLTGILGFVELAKSDLPTGHATRPWLDHIAQAGGRAKGLVQQILTFSRQTESDRATLDPAPLVAEALRLARSTLPPMVHLEPDFAPALPSIVANPTQIHQIVMNLLTNSWHALPASGGTIRIGLHRMTITETNRAELGEMPLGDALKITVADTGCGMDKATVDRIFDPFFTTKPPGQGTGLGLAVVHGIVRSHGGAIAVRSQPGAGTTFEIILPGVTAAVAQPPVEEHVIRRGAGQSILLVDDDEMARGPIALLLERLGYVVEPIAYPEIALEKFAQASEKYDLVITDFAMPRLTGADLTKRLREHRPDIPVLMLSGFVDPSHAEALENCGATLLLRKPVDLQQLSAAVTTCLAGR